MDIESIRTAIIVAKLRSFSLAATEIPCAQSTVSRQIRKLENDLNIKIFTRHTNNSGVSLTVEGQRVMPVLEKILSEYESLRSDAAAQDSACVTKIVLGIPRGSVLTPIGAYNLQTDFCMEHPDIEFTMHESTDTQMIEGIEIGRFDAAFLVQYSWNNMEPFCYLECNHNLNLERVGSHRMMLGVSLMHPLASRDSVVMEDLKGLDFHYPDDIRLMPASKLVPNQIMFLEACRRCGFTPNIVTTKNRNRAIRLLLTQQGRGVMLCALPAYLSEYKGIKYIPIVDCPMHADWYIITKKGANPAIHQKMVSFFRKYFNDSEAGAQAAFE